jgi:predicted MPP superfamily phosphohydrolase
MELEEPELKLLAEVMDAEAKGDPKSFQKDRSIAGKLDRIVAKATFKPGHHNLVFIGDILHDCFSNNKVAMDKLIRGLHAQGAVFVTGNHDVYGEVNPDNDLDLPDDELHRNHIQKETSAGQRRAEKKKSAYDAVDEQHDLDRAEKKFKISQEIKIQNGFYGAKQINKIASDKLLEKCFTNAYFDSQTNAFYTHNGFEHSGVEDVYLTAFGFLRAKNAEELAQKMNDSDFNSLGKSWNDIEKEIPDFKFKFKFNQEDNHGIDRHGFINKTNFRPADSRMQTGLLGPVGRTADEKKVTIFHGHNDNHRTAGNVVNLNARSDIGFSGFSPITKVF